MFWGISIKAQSLKFSCTKLDKPKPDNNIGRSDTKPLHWENDRYLSTTESATED